MTFVTRASAIVLVLCATPAAAEMAQVDQQKLNAMEDRAAAFAFAFEAGDELTEHSFTAPEGVGANIGEGRRFTRMPRADLTGPGEWASHSPRREGGANATSCIACHNAPLANGAGDVALNVLVDPGHTGNPALYLERNTLPLFALGVPQRLAEEMSQDLMRQRAAAEADACQSGAAQTALEAKGVVFGTWSATRTAVEPCVLSVDISGLEGIDADLVVRPFGWKGNHATLRGFTRGAAHNELGLQAVELVGDLDGDYDGVTHELSVGDMTALTIYMAALERPVSELELAAMGLIDLAPQDRQDIVAGEALFADTGCASCHVPSMTVSDTVFREPSRTPGFFEAVFPSGADPEAHGLTPETAIAFDLAGDQPNNRFEAGHLGALERDASGAGVARWYSDFKRHDMGAGLADPDDPLGLGAAVFLTRSLAGVGATGPWLHDGRATTLHDAIAMHGGAAEATRARYGALRPSEKDQIVRFLENLVIWTPDLNQEE